MDKKIASLIELQQKLIGFCEREIQEFKIDIAQRQVEIDVRKGIIEYLNLEFGGGENDR